MLGIFIGFTDVNDADDAAFLLFWVGLPLANAVWDWASWWVSRSLGADLLRKVRDEDRREAAKIWTGLWHGAVDLGAALVLLGALAWTLPKVLQWFLPVFADGGQWCRMAREPWGEGLWVTVMLLSTLFPTALHLMAVVASPVAAIALRFRQAPEVAETIEWANRIDDEDTYRDYCASRAFTTAVDNAAFYFALVRPAIWVAAAVSALFLLWLLIHTIWLAVDGLLFFLPGIDTLPEFLLGVAYDFDFTRAARCFNDGTV